MLQIGDDITVLIGGTLYRKDVVVYTWNNSSYKMYPGVFQVILKLANKNEFVEKIILNQNSR